MATRNIDFPTRTRHVRQMARRVFGASPPQPTRRRLQALSPRTSESDRSGRRVRSRVAWTRAVTRAPRHLSAPARSQLQHRRVAVAIGDDTRNGPSDSPESAAALPGPPVRAGSRDEATAAATRRLKKASSTVSSGRRVQKRARICTGFRAVGPPQRTPIIGEDLDVSRTSASLKQTVNRQIARGVSPEADVHLPGRRMGLAGRSVCQEASVALSPANGVTRFFDRHGTGKQEAYTKSPVVILPAWPNSQPSRPLRQPPGSPAPGHAQDGDDDRPGPWLAPRDQAPILEV